MQSDAPQHLLTLEGITVKFGGLVAAQDLTLSVSEGAIGAIIGPNGAGKTTVFNCITGIYTPASGWLTLAGEDIREPFTARTALITAIISATAAVATVLGLNIQPLWDAAINQLFVFGQPFDWRTSLQTFTTTLISLPLSHTIGAALIGAGIAAASYLTLWSSARHTPHTTLTRGIARTFQNIRLFKSMTTIENVLIGMQAGKKPAMLPSILRSARYRLQEQQQKERAQELLHFIGLQGLENAPATSLPYGSQRRLEIARALATNPKLLLLDEPAAGMNATEIAELMSLIERIRERGITVLLIEHHMKLVMGISSHITVLEYGRKIAEGTPHEIRSNSKVIAAYLGETHHD